MNHLHSSKVNGTFRNFFNEKFTDEDCNLNSFYRRNSDVFWSDFLTDPSVVADLDDVTLDEVLEANLANMAHLSVQKLQEMLRFKPLVSFPGTIIHLLYRSDPEHYFRESQRTLNLLFKVMSSSASSDFMQRFESRLSVEQLIYLRIWVSLKDLPSHLDNADVVFSYVSQDITELRFVSEVRSDKVFMLRVLKKFFEPRWRRVEEYLTNLDSVYTVARETDSSILEFLVTVHPHILSLMSEAQKSDPKLMLEYCRHHSRHVYHLDVFGHLKDDRNFLKEVFKLCPRVITTLRPTDKHSQSKRLWEICVTALDSPFEGCHIPLIERISFHGGVEASPAYSPDFGIRVIRKLASQQRGRSIGQLIQHLQAYVLRDVHVWVELWRRRRQIGSTFSTVFERYYDGKMLDDVAEAVSLAKQDCNMLLFATDAVRMAPEIRDACLGYGELAARYLIKPEHTETLGAWKADYILPPEEWIVRHMEMSWLLDWKSGTIRSSGSGGGSSDGFVAKIPSPEALRRRLANPSFRQPPSRRPRTHETADMSASVRPAPPPAPPTPPSPSSP
jgi:hypothetical protein